MFLRTSQQIPLLLSLLFLTKSFPQNYPTVSVPSAYCIIHSLDSQTFSSLSLLWTGRPQVLGLIFHPLLFMHIIPSSLPSVLFHHQSLRASVHFKSSQTRIFRSYKHIYIYICIYIYIFNVLPSHFGSLYNFLEWQLWQDCLIMTVIFY